MSISVLVADDSPTIRRRAQATLSEAGFDVRCVEDGESAWNDLQGGGACDVLLCDIIMPGLDGYELCRRLKADGRWQALPVLLLRGTFEPWDENKAHDAGADGFITKPFESESLVATVRDVLAAEPATAEAAAAPAEDAADPFGGGAEDAPAPEPAGDPLALGDDAPAAGPEPETAPAIPEPTAAPAPAPAAPAAAAASLDPSSLDEATLDALATKVAAKLAGDTLEKLAWEVVPEVAEALVRKRMIEIESKLQGG